MNYMGPGRVELSYEMPLAEVIFDFYDRFKSVTQGYGSFDYDMIDYRESNLVLMDILVNGEKVDALSQIVHRERARARALIACERLKDEIPGRCIRLPFRGHRRRSSPAPPSALSERMLQPNATEATSRANGNFWKSKRGKKRMKMIGQVSIPQSAFLAVLKSDND